MSKCESGSAEGAARTVAVVAMTALLVGSSLSLVGVAGAAQTDHSYVFAYADGDSEVTLVTRDSGTVGLGVTAEIVGSASDFDGDSVVEVPYVTGNNGLYVVEPSGETTKLASDAKKDLTKLTVGDLDGDGTNAVYYANVSGYIVAVEPGGTPRSVDGLTGVAALGVTDYDGDGDDDLVYVQDTNGPINYYDGENVASTEYTSIGSNNGLGVGAPADFDHTGAPRVPVVDSAGDIVLVAADGTKTVVTSDSMDKSPVTAADWTGDAALEVVHLESSTVKATTLDGETTTVTADGSSLVAQQDAGVTDVFPAPDEAVDVRSVDVTVENSEIRVAVNATEDLAELEVSLSGPEDATLTRSSFSESGSYTYTATQAVDTDGQYTVVVERVESTDGDVLTDAASETVTVDATGVAISGATLTDATDGDGVVEPGATVRVTADVSGDIGTVRADLSAFDAGTVTLASSDGGYAATATVGQAVSEGAYAVTVTAADGQGNSATMDTGTLAIDLAEATATETATPTDDTGDTTGTGVEYAASVDPATHAPTTVTRHAVTLTVDEATGSWNGLRIDYRGTGTDVSNVGQNDVVTLGIDRNDDGNGTTVDQSVTTDLSSVSGSGDGAVLTIGLGGNYNLRAGDELVVVYQDVRNPTAGIYNVTVDANPQSGQTMATAQLEIAEQVEASGTARSEASGVETTQSDETTRSTETTETAQTAAHGPGFGVAASVIVLLGAAVLLTRRER